ncbi:MAG: hypothetical protein ACO3F2_08575 [Roseiflexaceae bacterium]
MKIFHGIVITTLFLLMAMAASIVVEDEFAIYDQVTLVVSVAWALANWVLMLQPASTAQHPWHQWLVRHGIRKPHMFIAGVGLILVVIVRHAIQVEFLHAQYGMVLGMVELISRYAQAVLVTWCIGWIYVVMSVWPPLSYATIYQTYRTELLGLGGLLVIAIGLRTYQLGLVPNILNGDEGLIGWWAASLFKIDGPLSFVFGAIDGVGTTYLYLMSLIFDVFGQNAMSLRFLPALAGIGSILTNYWLARQLFGRRVAIITAVLLIFAHTHIHFSRQVAVSYIYANLFMPIYLWGVWQVVATKRMWPAIVAACALMLHVNFYLDAWAWAVFLIILVCAWAVVDRHAVRAAIRPLLLMFGLMLLGLSPMIIWASAYSGEFMSRMSMDGSITTGWISNEAELYGVSEIVIVYQLFEAAILAFLTQPFIDFYHAGVPILDGVSAVVFVIGMGLVHWQMRQRRMLLLLGWFWGGVTALAVLTIPISTYHYRLFAVVPVVYLIVAYTYDVVLKRIDTRFGVTASRIIIGLILMFFAIQNVQIYRTQLVDVCRYGGDLRTQQAGVISNYLYTLNDPSATVLIYGNLDEFHYGPWMTMDFMNPGMEYINVTIETDSRQFMNERESVYVVVVPERYFLIEPLSEQYNTNRVVDLTHCGESILRVMKANKTE